MDKRRGGGGGERLRKEREDFFEAKRKADTKGAPETFLGTRFSIKDTSYVVTSHLGSGFFAEVYGAKKEGSDEEVAVKISRPFEQDHIYLPENLEEDVETITERNEWNIREDTENVRRLFKEVAALKKLGREEGSPYPHFIDAQFVPSPSRPNLRRLVMVMEKIVGENLEDLTEGDGLEKKPEEVIQIALQIARAIQFTHDRGFVHRDIKPENILLEAGGRVRILDLGIVVFRNPKKGVTYQRANKNLDVGSLGFMVHGEKNPFGPERDVYAGGATLERMLLGNHVVRLNREERKEEIERISDERLRKLGEIAFEMKNEDPEKRPQISEAIEDIEALQRV